MRQKVDFWHFAQLILWKQNFHAKFEIYRPLLLLQILVTNLITYNK